MLGGVHGPPGPPPWIRPCKEHPISIAFSNPGGIGSMKTRADFSHDMKEVWKRMEDQSTYNTEKVIGIEQSHTKFQLTSTPGSQAKVTLTQVICEIGILEKGRHLI